MTQHIGIISGADLDRYLALSGMAYHSGRYTPEEWQDKTGVNPRLCRWVKVGHGGMCEWTVEAERIVKAHHNQVASNWHSLGIGCR